MAYVFDPINNTLIDDEDKSLGNKFALLDSELEKAIKELNEKFGPGTVQQGTQGIPPPPIKTPQAIFEFEERMKGRMAEGGRVNFAAAGLALPALSYPVNLGIAKILGITTAGVGAKELGNKVTDYIQNNPEILNDPRFKAAALAFGINIPGYIAPDATEMEKEAEKIREMTKPVGSPAEPPIKIDTTTGDSEPPKIDTTEKFPAELEKLPFREEFPMETQQLPIIFENRKAATDDLKKDFDDKSWKDTVVITGSPSQGTRKSVSQKTNVPFFEKLNTYTKEYHGGNLKSAIKEITGIQTKPRVRDKTLESLYTTISNAAKRSDFKFDTTGNFLQSDIEPSKVLLKLPEFTNQLKTNPNVLDNRIKELKIGKDVVLNRKQLQDVFGLDKSNRRQNNFLFEIIKDQGVSVQDLPGGRKGFLLEDAITAIKDYAKNKLSNYESRKYSSSLKKKSSEIYKLRANVDGKDFMNLNSQINKSINKTLGKNDLYFPDSVGQVGHNPVPVGYYDKIEMLRDKELADKIFNIQNYTWQGKEINYEVLAQTSGKLEKALQQLNQVYGKTVTEKNIGKIENAADDIRDYFNSAVKAASDVSKKLPFHKEVIGELIVSVPEIGETFNADSFEVDMSNVDKRFIIGNVDLINPNAVKYKDLSKEEKAAYGQNIVDQKVEQLKEFYGPNGADYPPEIIEDLIEEFEFGDEKKLGVLQRKGLGFKKGGGVEITPLPRTNFGNGGAAGADENFAAELEYFLTNPEAEIPKMQTYKETMNPVQILNDIIDPRNYPYYADVLARSGLRVGEFGVRFLPAVGKLISDLIRKPAFKITGTGKNNYVQDYTDILPSNIKGTGIFTEFLNNITPTATEKFIGLDKLIKKEEQKQKDRGSTVGPKVFADTIGLGVEVTAPIFPGLRFLRAYAANRNLPVNDTTQKILTKEIDEVLESRGMNRREFLQATGASATIVLAKMLGISDDMGRTAKVAEKVAEKTTTSVGVPPYFFKLVEKIKRNGKKLEPEYDPRVENNMTYGGFELRENMTTGEITIGKVKEGEVAGPNDSMYSGVMSDELISYKPGEPFLAKDGKYYKTADEYEEFTARPDEDGKMKDVEPGLDSIEEIIEILPNQLKMSELEKAGYNVDAFPDNIKRLLIDDLQKTN